MKVQSINEWDKLNHIIVGKGFDESIPNIDLSYKLFFHDNIYNQKTESYEFGTDKISKNIISEINEDIENFVNLLLSHNIKVDRPSLPNVDIVKTPAFNASTHNCLNARDMSLVINNKIIQTPPLARFRYFEGDLLKGLFNRYYQEDKNMQWVQAPKALMTDNSFDLSYIQDGIEKINNKYDIGLESMWDAAQCMRFNNDIIFNVSNENHKMGAEWLQRYLGNDYSIHVVEWCDNHIDSTLVPLREGLIMIDKNKDEKVLATLPDFLKNWDKIYIEHLDKLCEYSNNEKLLASNAIDMNVLSIDPNTIICHDIFRPYLQKKLSKYKIDCIPCKMRHSQLQSGAFHCVTLDINRG